MCPECALANRSLTLNPQLSLRAKPRPVPANLSATFRVASIAVPAPAATLRSVASTKELNKCLPANSRFPANSPLLSAPRPAAAHPRPAAAPLAVPDPAAADPTPGPDRPQGEHPAQSPPCPRRNSP